MSYVNFPQALNGGLGYRVESVATLVLLGYALDVAQRDAVALANGLAPGDVQFNLEDFKSVERGYASAVHLQRFISTITTNVAGSSRTFYPRADWVLQFLVEKSLSSSFPMLYHMSDGTKANLTASAGETTAIITAIRDRLRAGDTTLATRITTTDTTVTPGSPIAPPPYMDPL